MSCHYGKVMEGWEEAIEGSYRVWSKDKSAGEVVPICTEGGREGGLESAAIRCHSRSHGTNVTAY